MVRIFFMTVVFWLFLTARTAFAQDTPTFAPTRLDFDAMQAPKNCNDDVTFRLLLTHWLEPSVFSSDASRRLSVRIHRSPTGGKLADVMLFDADGAAVAEEHKTFASKTECHKVLWESAQMAAKLMGAFEKPPAPEPITCPVCPACPAPAETARCPLISQRPPIATVPRVRPAVPLLPYRRAFFGAGVFLGTGITSKVAIGPSVSLGFVPSRHSPRIQIEIDGAWSRQTLPQSLQVQVVPLYGALCYSRYVFRICSGLTATFFQMEHTAAAPGNDESRTTLAGHLRMGTEFEIAGPFSIRVDGFATLRFWQRSFGADLAKLDARNPFGAGAQAMAVWSFE